jgi:hypothetical protein
MNWNPYFNNGPFYLLVDIFVISALGVCSICDSLAGHHLGAISDLVLGIFLSSSIPPKNTGAGRPFAQEKSTPASPPLWVKLVPFYSLKIVVKLLQIISFVLFVSGSKNIELATTLMLWSILVSPLLHLWPSSPDCPNTSLG